MKSSEIWTELGNTYFKTGELDKAIDAYCKAIEQKTLSGWSYCNLATIYVQQGRLLEAIPLYQKSLELFSSLKDKAATWGRLGNIYRNLNEHGKAIQAYQKADEILPSQNCSNPSLLTSLERAINEPDIDLQTEYDSVGEVNQSVQPLLLSTDGTIKVDASVEIPTPVQGLSEGGSSKFENVIEQSATVWNELGLILFKVGSYDDAIDSFHKAIEIEPALGYLYSNLGQVYIAQGRLLEAVPLFEKSIELLLNKKDKAVSWNRLGDIYRQLGQFDEANAAYRLAEALNQVASMPVNEYRQVNQELITIYPGQARDFSDIDDLVGSIRIHGIIQPLVVCPGRNDPGKFALIAGQRRLEAARRLGLKEVPVIIRQASEEEILELSINENIHSAAISPFDLANMYRQLVNDFDLSIEEISIRVGRSCHSVANTMKVYDLPQETPQLLEVNDSLMSLPFDMTPITDQQAHKLEDQVGVCAAQGDEILINAVSMDSNSNENVPTLWYLESENESVLAGAENLYSSDKSSLLSRAQNVLSCNQHSRRLWAAPSYRV